MTSSFSTSPLFIISWKNKHENKQSVKVGNFILAMELYLKLKVDKAELWYFPHDGREPSVVRRRRL